MKILVLSLLRIGDIVLSAPALRGLREKHPHAEIHLMINKQFAQVASLLPYIDKVLLFDRDRLQKGLGNINTPMFESFERLQDFVDEVDANRYDKMINLTHSRLSGWMMSVIGAKERVGLAFDPQGRATFGANWFRYLNNQVDADGNEVFHFSDVFRFALGVSDQSPLFESLIETDRGAEEAEEFLRGGAGGVGLETISVQALTSDTKKDWGLERFAVALALVQRSRPQARFAIMGAPFEREKLEPLMVRLASMKVNAHLAILSFEGAYSLVRRSSLLLTGDTSIKHLACAARTPVIELSMGSSDPYRTGAYHHGSLILQSREACAPCSHSSACHQKSHLCSARIPAEAVAMVMCEALEGRSFQLRHIADEFKHELDIRRVNMKATGMWTAPSVLEAFTEANVGHWIDLTCRKLWLEGTTDRMGTEIRMLGELFEAIFPDVSEIEWRHMLGDLERQAASVEGRLNAFKIGLQSLRGAYEDPRQVKEFVRALIAFRERIRHSALLASFKESLDRVIEDDISPAFTRFRMMSDLVGEIDRRTEIYLKLIRGLEHRDDSRQRAERA